ncbi:hypothetical protein ACFL1C_05760 [Pseudomonadota bacterium]
MKSKERQHVMSTGGECICPKCETRIPHQRVFVRGLDCLDGTPLLDIKPAMLKEAFQHNI